MEPNILVALITGGFTAQVAVSALVLNYRGFGSLEKRMLVMEADHKEFFKIVTRQDTDITYMKDDIGRIKNKLGI